MNRYLNSKITAFLKKAFFLAFLYSTLLYIVIRLFFYEFPFTISDGCELHSKILLVVWIFLIACKLVISVIILVENNIPKIKSERPIQIPVPKKSSLIQLNTAQVLTGKTVFANSSKVAAPGNNSCDLSVIEPDLIC